MKIKTTFFKKQIPVVLIILLVFMSCYRFDFVNQPFSADINSSFEAEVSVVMNPGGG